MTESEVAERRKLLYSLLGDLPDPERPIGVETIRDEEVDGEYRLQTLVLDLNGIEEVPAYLATPIHSKGRVPAELYNHAHGGDYVLGKTEFTSGRGALQPLPYARALTSLGYCGLCIAITGCSEGAADVRNPRSSSRCCGKGGCCGG